MAKQSISQYWSGFSLPHAPHTFFFHVPVLPDSFVKAWAGFVPWAKCLWRTGLAIEIICSIYLNKFLNPKLPRIKKAHAIKEKQKLG